MCIDGDGDGLKQVLEGQRGGVVLFRDGGKCVLFVQSLHLSLLCQDMMCDRGELFIELILEDGFDSGDVMGEELSRVDHGGSGHGSGGGGF